MTGFDQRNQHVVTQYNVVNQGASPGRSTGEAPDTFDRLEKLIPELLAEMRADLVNNPLSREFIILKKGWVYNSGGKCILVYYYDDHPQLEDKLDILQNIGFIQDVTYNNTKRYRLSEAFVDYLLKS